MKKILWRCDDFGSATGANEAILRLAKTGLPLNVSVLVCAHDARTGIEELAKLAPQVCLGIHAAINSEWIGVKLKAVGKSTRTTGLVDAEGCFYPDNAAAQKVPPEIIAAEIKAQIELAQAWGIPFSYLDEHMCFGWLPGVAPLLAGLASSHGLVYQRDLPFLPKVKDGSGDLVERTAQQLAAVNDETLHVAVFHPALDDASTQQFYNNHKIAGVVSRERQEETNALSSEAWKRLVSQNDVQLLTYRDL